MSSFRRESAGSSAYRLGESRAKVEQQEYRAGDCLSV